MNAAFRASSKTHFYWGNDALRYTFNGKEKENEIAEGDLDFGARVYDSRLGRWMSVDPLSLKFPDFSPFIFAANNPTFFIDVNGEEPCRNQAGTIQEAAAQWRGLENQTVKGILDYIQTDPNAVRYVFTEEHGWIDLQHYYGTLYYGETAMDALEPVSGSTNAQSAVLGDGANASYYSYEDLPSNAFAGTFDKNNYETQYKTDEFGVVVPDIVATEKSGEDLIESVEKHFTEAKATEPEMATNWYRIPFMDHERERLPDVKLIPFPGGESNAGWPMPLSQVEKGELLATGKYVPQNHSELAYDLVNKQFPAADSSLLKGDTQKGATGH